MKLPFARDQDVTPEGPLQSRLSTTAQNQACHYHTTRVERMLLFITVMLLPLPADIPGVPGVSSMFVVFAVLAGYVAINRLWCLDRIWMHPVFVVAYVFIVFSAAIEFTHPFSSYEIIGSFALTISGALLVASLCRDRDALKMLLYGYIGAALWLGAILFLTVYGTLSGVQATSFNEASKVRAEAFKDIDITGGMNGSAIQCVQGGIVALAFALGSASVRVRNVFTLIGIFCLVASTLPMSRSAIINAMVSCGAVLKAYGMKTGKAWLLVGLLAVSGLLLVPDAIWSRMSVITKEEGKQDSHVTYIENAIEAIDDYVFTGVGAGNYFKKWGFEHGYGKKHAGSYVVYMIHSVFLQVWVFWGIIGLLLFLAVIWQAYRCLPRSFSNDPLALGMLGVATSLLVIMPFSASFTTKGLSLGLGMLVAYQRWQLENR